jgi:hypothetical protein
MTKHITAAVPTPNTTSAPSVAINAPAACASRHPPPREKERLHILAEIEGGRADRNPSALSVATEPAPPHSGGVASQIPLRFAAALRAALVGASGGSANEERNRRCAPAALMEPMPSTSACASPALYSLLPLDCFPEPQSPSICSNSSSSSVSVWFLFSFLSSAFATGAGLLLLAAGLLLLLLLGFAAAAPPHPGVARL